ncbi:MAG: ATP-binding SpoIIE family protein phosphatase [Thermoleophilia bacterium]
MSRRLQHALLPDQLLRDPALELAARYRPATDGLEVGGDWYDAFPLPDGRVGLAVGDVVGHGLEAAAAMGRLRTALVALAPHADGPGSLLSLLDDFAAGPNGTDFATAVVASLDPATGALRYASAGHLPLLVVSADGTCRWLEDGRSTPLCGLPRVARREAATVLDPGDLLVLCSDGLVERRGESLAAGLARLAAAGEALADASAEAACDRLLAAAGQGAGEDDVVVLCARFAPVETRRFRRSLPAAPGELAPLRAAARAWLVARAHSEDTQERLLLGLGEAVTNAIEHAYRDGGTGIVDVAIVDDGDSLGIEVRDYGRWRQPSPIVPGRRRGTDILDAVGERVVRRTGREGTTVSFAVPVAVPLEA